MLRLAEAWHARVMADDVVGHAFGHGFHPEHSRRLAAYCRFPPCNRRAIDGELDHTRAWNPDDGETSEENLYGGCVHHHHLTHDAPGRTVTQRSDGTITWTTPTGHRYSSRPYDYRPEPPLPVRPSRPGKPAVPERRDVLGRDLALIEPLAEDAVDDAPF